jgi:hypothetical protein
MQEFEIVRDHMDKTPTTGKLLVEGEHFCYTLERPWLDNRDEISCIPEGTYQVLMKFSHHFGRPLPHLLDVPGRDHIMIHVMNVVEQSKGCIGVGESLVGSILSHSTSALGRFLVWFSSVGSTARVTIRTGGTAYV